MDFLNSCSTNLRSLEDVFHISAAVYAPFEEDWIPYAAATDLRQLGILCTSTKHEFWTFAAQPAQLQTFDPISHGLRIKEEGTLQTLGSSQAEHNVDIRRIFLEALEGGVSFSLGQAGLLRVGSWSWCSPLPTDAIGQRNVLSSMQARIRESGAFDISVSTKPCSFTSLSDRSGSLPNEIIIAPSGIRVQLVARHQSVNTDQAIIEGESWRSTVSRSLAIEGITLDVDDGWSDVQLCHERSSGVFQWPTRLCLCSKFSLRHAPEDYSGGWKAWFDQSIVTRFQDPLAVAAEWFTESKARRNSEGANSDCVIQTNDDSAADTVGPPTSAADIESQFATSPAFNQRIADHQAAMAGIYPTPPDGLAPGSATVHMTSDGHGGAMQIDQAVMISDRTSGSDDARMREESLDAAPEQPGYQPHADDLFGDMGGLDFGDNEVGDADFDYFDEPDDLESQHALDESEMVDSLHGEAVDDPDVLREENVQAAEADSKGDHDVQGMLSSLEQSGLLAAPTEDGVPLPTIPSSPSPETVREIGIGIQRKSEMPLSPFGIRERLLPPPIPASLSHTENTPHRPLRRGSMFTPVAFNEGLDLRAKYSILSGQERRLPTGGLSGHSAVEEDKQTSQRTSTQLENWSPLQRPAARRKLDSDDSDDSNGSDEDHSDSETIFSEARSTAQSPWKAKKRRRRASCDVDTIELRGAEQTSELEPTSGKRLSEILNILNDRSGPPISSEDQNNAVCDVELPRPQSTGDIALPSPEELFELKNEDLVYVAQVITEQSVSPLPAILRDVSTSGSLYETNEATVSAANDFIESVLTGLLSELSVVDLATVALAREPLRPTMAQSRGPSSTQPRSGIRPDSVSLGPDCFPLGPPYVRVQRGHDTWEMLPPALSVWDMLGLGPVSGSKDVQVVGIAPSADDLSSLVKDFVDALGDVYESRRLGGWKTVSLPGEGDNLDDLDGFIKPVKPDAEFSLPSALKAYARASTELGRALASIAHLHADRTIVVFIVDPFRHEKARQHLYACFWLLCKAYRDNKSKHQRASPCSDLVLQLIPIDLIVSPASSGVLDAEHLAALAVDTYDRCPPSASSKIADQASALPIIAAPSFEIAPMQPKRIAFQLNAEAPSDLLHEGSILNVAYALSPDNQWMTAVWVDGTGRYYSICSSSIRGRSFAELAHEVWFQTLDILAARDVTWRVFIVAANQCPDSSFQACWRAIVGVRPRKQPLLATLVSLYTQPEVRLTPSATSDDPAAGAAPVSGVFTPVTTPQSAGITMSPDPSGGHPNAPPTPAPSDAVASMAENDPDAHLVDLTDESWGMLLSPAYAFLPDTLVSGLLLKRGRAEPGSPTPLDALGVQMHWDIRVRPGGVVDDSPPRQAEATLREVLRMFRNLGVLAKAKRLEAVVGIDGVPTEPLGLLPLHVVAALRGAQGLDGFLDAAV